MMEKSYSTPTWEELPNVAFMDDHLNIFEALKYKDANK